MVRKQTPWLAANLVYAGVLVVLGLVPDLPPFGKDVPGDLQHGAAYALQPARTFEGRDVLANAVGAGAGVAATYLWMPRGRKSGLQ